MSFNPFVIQEGVLGLGAVEDATSSKLIDASFENVGMASHDGAPIDFIKRTIAVKNFFLVAIYMSFLGIIVFGRIAYLQIIRGDYYHGLAENNRVRARIIKAARGVIYDRAGRQLVQNVPSFTLAVVPADLPRNENERLRFFDSLAKTISVSKEEIVETIEEFSKDFPQPVPVKENLEYEQAMLLKIKSVVFPGVVLELTTHRQYADKTETQNSSKKNAGASTLAHILGYEGKLSKDEFASLRQEGYTQTDRVGKAGIEYAAEKILRGRNGKTKIEVDYLGKEKSILASESAYDGENVVLTIDSLAQSQLENILSLALIKAGSKRGAAIALDPRNGEILAMVSLPSFSNNDFALGLKRNDYQKILADENKPLFSRAISGEYPSGSTIKPLIAAAALEEKVITPETTFLSTGGIQINKWFFPDWKAGGHGLTNVIKAIAESVNTFFYLIGGGSDSFSGLGPERIVRYAQKFGFGEKLGIDLPGEASGFLPTEEWKQKKRGEPWYIGDTYHLAIGQGDLLVTPLQIASMTAIIANGGKFYTPHIIKSTVDSLGQEKRIEPRAIRDISLRRETFSVVRKGMREAVLKGSARSLQTLSRAAAGKTGTAQGRAGKPPHAWFTGFAPFENPEIIITVLVEEGGEGSAFAVPVAKEFLEWYFREYIK